MGGLSAYVTGEGQNPGIVNKSQLFLTLARWPG